MGFREKTPQYHAGIKVFEAVSPKHISKQTDLVVTTSPTEDEKIDNNNDFLMFKDIDRTDGRGDKNER